MKHNKNNGRNVPNLRFSEFEGDWEEVELKDVCTFFSGGTPTSTNREYYDGHIPFIRSGEIDSDRTELLITEAAFNSSSAKMVAIGDLLIALYGATSGEIGICKINGAINQAILCVKTSQNKMFLKFIWGKSVKLILKTYLQGGQGNLSAEIIKRLKFFFAKDLEQEKIAEFLTLIDERISTQNKIIEELKLLKCAMRYKLYSNLNHSNCVLCEFKTILDYEQPTKYIVDKDEYCSDSSLVAVLTANKAFVLGYTSEKSGIYDKGECIIFDDFTMDSKFVDFPFKVKSSAIKILRAKDGFDAYFVFEYIAYLHLSSEEHKRHYISEIESRCLNIPHYDTQLKIASLLRQIENRLINTCKITELYHTQKQYLLCNMFI